MVHVINHTAQSRSIRLTREDHEDLTSEVFLTIVNDDFAVLRHFRRQSSLATYLTVIARRIIVRELLKRKNSSSLDDAANHAQADGGGTAVQGEKRISDREEIERLMAELNGPEAEVVRLFHLEGKSYQEISDRIGIPENSIGPTLSRARAKMRRAGADSTTA